MPNGEGIDIEGTAAKVSGGRPWLVYGALAGGAIGLVVLIMRSMQSGQQQATSDPNDPEGSGLPYNGIVMLGSLQNQLLEYTGAQSIWNREEMERDSQILGSVGLARGDILSSIALAKSDILAGQLAIKNEVLSTLGATEADILAGVTATRGDLLAALNTLSGRVLSGDAQILNAVARAAELEGWTSKHILDTLGEIQSSGHNLFERQEAIRRVLNVPTPSGGSSEQRSRKRDLAEIEDILDELQERIDSMAVPVGAGGIGAGTIFDTVWSKDGGNGTGNQWFARVR